MNKQDMIDYLRPHGQEHLVQFWDELNEDQKQSLIDEIKILNLSELNRVFVKSMSGQPFQQTSDDMHPVPDNLKGILILINSHFK